MIGINCKAAMRDVHLIQPMSTPCKWRQLSGGLRNGSRQCVTVSSITLRLLPQDLSGELPRIESNFTSRLFYLFIHFFLKINYMMQENLRNTNMLTLNGPILECRGA